MDFKMKQPNEVRMAEWSRMHSGRRLILQAWVQIHLQTVFFSQVSFDIFVKTLQLFTHGNILKYKKFRWINYWHKISRIKWLRIDHDFLQNKQKAFCKRKFLHVCYIHIEEVLKSCYTFAFSFVAEWFKMLCIALNYHWMILKLTGQAEFQSTKKGSNTCLIIILVALGRVISRRS